MELSLIEMFKTDFPGGFLWDYHLGNEIFLHDSNKFRFYIFFNIHQQKILEASQLN
jgi:hypothetical protein